MHQQLSLLNHRQEQMSGNEQKPCLTSYLAAAFRIRKCCWRVFIIHIAAYVTQENNELVLSEGTVSVKV